MVRINSGAPEPTDKFNDTPRDRWDLLLIAKRMFLVTNLSYDCRCLIEFCEEAEEVYADLGYASSEEMIREGYELDPAQVELAVAWLKANGIERPVAMSDIVPLAKHGVNQHCKTQVGGDNVTSSKRGNHTEYALRRLARDCPEMLDKIEAGELSVNAAAIQAGIRKKLTQEDICLRSFKKCSNHAEMLTRLREYYETFIASDSTKP